MPSLWTLSLVLIVLVGVLAFLMIAYLMWGWAGNRAAAMMMPAAGPTTIAVGTSGVAIDSPVASLSILSKQTVSGMVPPPAPSSTAIMAPLAAATAAVNAAIAAPIAAVTAAVAAPINALTAAVPMAPAAPALGDILPSVSVDVGATRLGGVSHNPYFRAPHVLPYRWF